MSISPASINTLCSITPIFCLVLAQIITYLAHCSEVAHRPVKMQIPLCDWMYSFTGLLISCICCALSAYYIFRKKRSFLPKSRTLWLSIFIAAIWSVLFNPFPMDTLTQLPISVLFIMAWVYISIAVFRAASYAIWVIILILSLIQYAAHSQGLILDYVNMMQIFSTSWEDARPYLSTYNIVLMSGAVILSVGGYHIMYRTVRKSNSLSSIAFTGSLFLVLFFVCVKPLQHHLNPGLKYIWPIGNTEALINDSGRAIINLARVNKMMRFLPPQGTSQASTLLHYQQSEKPIVILHIGESVRSDHMSLYGYSRLTTPFLDSLANLVVFRDCISAESTTDRALMVMLTNGRRDFIGTQDKRFYPTSPAIAEFFADCHFNCASFWGPGILTGPQHAFFTKEVEFFTRSIPDNYEHLGHKGKVQLPQIKDFIDKTDAPLFLMLNNRGSHLNFDAFEQDKAPFRPVRIPQPHDEPLTNPEHADNFRNAYDNTIHYTDEYIKELFSLLAGKPFLYVYVSDHGEYVGDEGYFGRGTAPRSIYHKSYACQVPFLVYASPELENLHPHFKEAMSQLRRHQQLSVGHEHLFHTLLGFFNIKTPYYMPELDLCRNDVHPYTGPHPSRNGKSADGKK